eukprot:8108683-Alexandrium_andersonii.AAC.1
MDLPERGSRGRADQDHHRRHAGHESVHLYRWDDVWGALRQQAATVARARKGWSMCTTRARSAT